MKISLEHLRQLAYSAYSGTSFSPERRADSIVKDYTEELNEDLQSIVRALKAIQKGVKPKVNELEQSLLKLRGRQRWQRLMVAANKIIRKGGLTVQDQLAMLGLSSGDITRLLIPDWAKRTGFKPFQFSNNNAEIHRLQKRVQALKEKQRMAETTGNTTEEIKGIHLVQNYEADRVQILFPDRPTKETCQALRKAGFLWSPSTKGWQRQLNPLAVNIARQFIERL